MISVIGIIGAISIIGYNSLLFALSSFLFLVLLKPTYLSPFLFSNYLVFRLAGRRENGKGTQGRVRREGLK